MTAVNEQLLRKRSTAALEPWAPPWQFHPADPSLTWDRICDAKAVMVMIDYDLPYKIIYVCVYIYVYVNIYIYIYIYVYMYAYIHIHIICIDVEYAYIMMYCAYTMWLIVVVNMQYNALNTCTQQHSTQTTEMSVAGTAR